MNRRPLDPSTISDPVERWIYEALLSRTSCTYIAPHEISLLRELSVGLATICPVTVRTAVPFVVDLVNKLGGFERDY